jgi:RNA polymerase sigma factor (sigma-70 family)
MQDFSEASDAQLVTSIGRYSEVALAEVYRRHGGAVFGLARRVLDNTVEAEDVTQEVFLRLWNQPDKFDPLRGSLRSFLLAQSHARAVDVIRSQNARRARETNDAAKTAHGEYDMQHEAWDLSLASQVNEALGLAARRRASCHRTRVLRGTHLRAGRRDSQSTRREPSRVEYVTACGACAACSSKSGVTEVEHS